MHSIERNPAAALRKMLDPCVVMVTEKSFENLNVQGVNCELLGRDLNGRPYQIVQVSGLTTAWAINNKLVSGVTTLFSENAQINDETNQLIFTPGALIKVSPFRSVSRI